MEYALYFQNTTYQFGLMSIYQFMCAMIILITTSKKYNKEGKIVERNIENTYLFLISIFTVSIGMFFHIWVE